MLISQVREIERGSSETMGWSGLREFHNVRFTTERILELHKKTKSNAKNAEKQANQIRYFLLQAKEYFDASTAVTLVTRPALLYYCAMCLATAEVLFKQSGLISLDMARSRHRHHGLTFSNEAARHDRDRTLPEAAAKLRAKPATREDGARFGTFSLWHDSARPYSAIGKIYSVNSDNNISTHYTGIVGLANDKPFPNLPRQGLSFMEVVKNVPQLSMFASRYGVDENFVRGILSLHVDPVKNRTTLSMVLHPSNPTLFAKFCNRCLFNANDHPKVEFREGNNAGVVTLDVTEGIAGTFPSSVTLSPEKTYFYVEDESLNEFGYLYLALFILGNYARYYPDFWIKDAEESTQIGLITERLLHIASDRLPLLSLSEMTRTAYIVA